jgi:hypothetical protein
MICVSFIKKNYSINLLNMYKICELKKRRLIKTMIQNINKRNATINIIKILIN